MMKDLEKFMQESISEAQKAVRDGEVPIGAVIVRDDQIIGRGYNRVENEANAARHAEIIAMEQASKALNNWRLENCTIFVTMEPCIMCIGAMILARLPRLYFGCRDPRLGACGSIFDLSAHPSLPHQLEVSGGLCEIECRELLQTFFQSKRS